MERSVDDILPWLAKQPFEAWIERIFLHVFF
jgi:hypothetical protein